MKSKLKSSLNREIVLLNLKVRIIDQTFNAFSLMAVIAYSITLYRALSYGFNLNFILATAMASILWLVTIFKNRISILLKVVILSLIIFVVLLGGLSQFGFLASAKIYIPIVPVFISFIYSYRTSVVLLFTYLLAFLIYGVLYVNNIIEYKIDADLYITSYISWALDASIICLTSWGLLYIGSLFQHSLASHNSKVDKQNQKLIEYINMNSHDVRGPLARILGLLELHKISSDETEKEKILNSIHLSAESLDDIIKSMNRLLEKEIIEQT